MNGSSDKKQSAKRIGTHDGTFHCDEVLACWMLKQLPQYKDAKIVRSHNPTVLKWCHVVVDIGGEYDPRNMRFDHHQKAFDGSMKSIANLKWETKLSSAGLVYLHFGKDVISELSQLPLNDIVVQKLFDKLYEMFIEEIDAFDNSIEQYEGTPRYHVTTTLGSRVEGLNPPWNVVNPDIQAAFDKAMEMCGSEFLDKLNYYKNVWVPGHILVEMAVDRRFSVHPSGEIIVFLHCSSLLEEHLFEVEEELNISNAIKFVLSQGKNLNWWVQCVPKTLGSFQNRLGLCEKWCGLRDETLCKVSGIPDSIFVHASGFIGSNKSYEGALEMAKLTLTSA